MRRSWLACAGAAFLLHLSRGQSPETEEVAAASSDMNQVQLHLMTFMFNIHRHFAYLQVTAESQQIYPQVMGLGKSNDWGQMGDKINAIRTFAFSKDDQDVMIVADAFDTLILAGRLEILRKFEELEKESGRSIVFNAEVACYPDSDSICEKTPPSKYRWRFLNAGLMVGRVHAFKTILPEALEGERKQVNDQWWWQIYRRDHPEKILLDTECKLTCNLFAVEEEEGISLEGRRLHVRPTGTVPPLIHFASYGHRTRWVNGRSTCYLQDVFRQLFPQESASLMEGWWIGIRVGSSHDLKIYEGPGFWRLLTSAICLQCDLGGVESDDCKYLRHSATCFWLNLGWFLLLLVLSFCILVCVRGRQVFACGQRVQVLEAWRRYLKPRKPTVLAATHHITLSHHGQVPYLEGQAIGVIAPGPERTGERPAKLRLYSIASSRSGDDQRSKTLSLCVKRVLDVSERDQRDRSRGVGGRKIGGVCSNYLCDVELGDKVVITGPTGNEMLLPEENCCNLILVATGAGIAPIRAQLRRLFHDVSAANPDSTRKFTGLAWLFYGVRYASCRLYEDEHMSYKAKFPDNFRYNCAISRESSDSGEKEYVQTQMCQHMDELWGLLQLPNTHIYACGVKGLEAGLSDCLASAARDRGQDWRELHKAMRTEGRYHVEVY
eukprot:s2798_g4.t1